MLGMMKDPVAVRQLCMAMHNPDPLLRMIIVEALGKIGDPAASTRCGRPWVTWTSRSSGAARKALKKMGALPGQK